MKTSACAVAVAVIVVGCGTGIPPGEGRSLAERSKAAATDSQRQAVLNACRPPNGRLTEAFCGVKLPKNGSDRTPQRWWDAAGCLEDHPKAFSATCKTLFKSTCGNGDDCICNPGFELDEDDDCTPIGACDNDNDCPAVANGKNKCSNTTEHDPAQGHCVLACDSGYVTSLGPNGENCVKSRSILPQCTVGADPETLSKFTVCDSNQATAWISAVKGGGTYHAQQICVLLGYPTLAKYGGNADNVCGSAGDSNTSCSQHGTEVFNGGGDAGSDAFGKKLSITVTWLCTG